VPVCGMRSPVTPRARVPTERRSHPDERRRDECATRRRLRLNSAFVEWDARLFGLEINQTRLRYSAKDIVVADTLEHLD
jgi:hypothetical protein